MKPANSPERKLLIVDDDPDLLELIKTKLEAENYSCEAAPNVETALALVRERQFDLVISDLRLPGIDGFTFIEVLKAKYPALGIIVITGMAEIESAVKAMRAGADDYLTKPFNLDHMVISIERTLEKQRLIIENRDYQQFLEQRVREATQEQRKVFHELRKTKEYLENLIESCVDAIISFDLNGKIRFCNRSTENLLGRPVAEVLGQHICTFCSGGRPAAERLIKTIHLQQKVRNCEIELLSVSSNQITTASVSASLLQDVEDSDLAIIAIFKDITEQKKLQTELQELSIKDNLTSLFNQRHFYRVLEKEMIRAARQKHPLCLLLLDLDNFKQFNDSQGHLAGDRILEQVGSIINECTREYVDHAFRYGGDEFTIILSETTIRQATEVAERIQRSLKQAFSGALSLSIGLAQFRAGLELENFINSADKAMYNAKRAGGNQIALAGVRRRSVHK
ncbi:MAG: diguanylate cyclase [Candidatus Abyssobacteria bacterium SURF_5]|uniref:diguanylate cyclase n=1 Tax=Abyssobacteria bacterium (strain SURF_5) TaxID=2093360 RepID=A0A3A4NG46_ABYX5|nr:MAG: diguanylate cyclase [Candidatus Abyssubacteria bacterium SURF_5]